MHYSSLYAMRYFVSRYLDPDRELRVLEVGSRDLHNPRKQLVYRRYFRNPKWEFVGLDLEPGRNVDVVATHPYRYPFGSGSFDVVITGNTLEHVRDMYLFVSELSRLTRDLVCVIVPNTHPEHRHPVDCWRVFPDGMRFLLGEVAAMEVLECRTWGNPDKDTIGIARLCREGKS